MEPRTSEAQPNDHLFEVVYDELRRVARAHLAREAPGHTLSTTALVHEAYLRLADVSQVSWQDRNHFLSMAARAMRRMLVDYARQRKAARRGGGARAVTLDDALQAADHQADTLLELDDALGRLGALSPRLAQVVELRFFGGLTEDEAAGVLAVTPRTVRRDWVKARGWLHGELATLVGPELTA